MNKRLGVRIRNTKACHCEGVSVNERPSQSQSRCNEITTSCLCTPRNDKRAFTLAEVLITLGIIGVVAAITIPTLIKNYQKKVWTTQLQKTYSVLEQGFQKMLADEEVGHLTDTSVWIPNMNQDVLCYWDSDYKTGNCKEFGENLGKYFKNIGFEEYGITDINLDGVSNNFLHDGMPMILPDGTMVFLDLYVNETKSAEICNDIKSKGGNMCSNLGTISIDVNGKKAPNTWGRDIFMFHLSNEGRLYPIYGKDYALFHMRTSLENNGYYWGKEALYCGVPGGNANESEGSGCAARIIENGWKMDY